MLTDTKIIKRIGATEIVAQRHEVMLPDGLPVTFHPVYERGVEQPLRRALRLPGDQLAVFHLSKLSATLCNELQMAHARDRPGIVFFTLRQLFRTRNELLEAVFRGGCVVVSMSDDASALKEAA